MFLFLILTALLGVAVSAPAPKPSGVLAAAPVVYTAPLSYSYSTFTSHPAVSPYGSQYYVYPPGAYAYNYPYVYY